MLVAKVGGSLFDLPTLGPALARWCAEHGGPVLLVPGGGAFADAVRALDQVHRLGEEASHWLAVRAMTLNAHVLLTLLPESKLTTHPPRGGSGLFVLDCFNFFQRHDTTPHTWGVTSDTLALVAAIHLDASRLVLLKSVACEGVPWVAAAGRGWVDEHFAELADKADFPVDGMDFRAWAE